MGKLGKSPSLFQRHNLLKVEYRDFVSQLGHSQAFLHRKYSEYNYYVSYPTFWHNRRSHRVSLPFATASSDQS